MAVAFLILLQALLIFLGIDGKGFRTPCSEYSYFRCDNGNCVAKHKWCDGSRDCGDGSDETYCASRNLWGLINKVECDDSIHFQCWSGMCIPIQGYCDGYSSCEDRSDEEYCPCEELLEREGNFEYEAFISNFRTQHKCWKLAVKEGQYLNLSIQAALYDRDCEQGNISIISSTIKSDKEPDYRLEKEEGLICPVGTPEAFFTFTDDVRISYRSNWYSNDRVSRDLIKINYNKVDTECWNSDTFKCSKISCISSEKRCDGNKDCENGLDEKNCDFATFAVGYLENNLKNATKWMRNQHNVDWGWKENTHRAIVALYLGQDLNFNSSSNEDDLIAKQIELEVFTHILRKKSDEISPTGLSAYINALLAICHNPRNFYGFDLIQNLKEELEQVPGYVTPLPYLTLCNAKENISEEVVNSLLYFLEKSSDHGFVLEVQALATIALSCISNTNQYRYIKQNITEALNNLKVEQREDGSFGNEYTTALVLQALIASNQTNDESWNFESFKSSIDFLRQKQNADGSFGDFLTTYLIMPILNGKSLVDVGNVHCTESLKRRREGNLTFDIKSKLGGKIAIKYSLFIGDKKDQIHPIVLRMPENVTVLELMALAADIDPKYKFKTHQIKKKTYVYEISGVPNDPENNKFWFFYRGSGNDTVPMSAQSPDEIRVSENDHIIAWYKTLNIM